MSKKEGDFVIEAKSLAKYFGKTKEACFVIDSLDFFLEEKELVVIVGQSGSGKTTLLNALGGLDRRYEGRISLFGQDIKRLSERKLSRLRNENIGFVFQHFHVLNHLNVFENVIMPQRFAQNATNKNEREKVGLLLERVGLAERKNDLVGTLSGGQKQRVAIARSLMMNPKLLLCDEPTGNLDHQTGEDIISIFKELHQDGVSLLVVTHEDRVTKVAQRVLNMKNGKLFS